MQGPDSSFTLNTMRQPTLFVVFHQLRELIDRLQHRRSVVKKYAECHPRHMRAVAEIAGIEAVCSILRTMAYSIHVERPKVRHIALQ